MAEIKTQPTDADVEVFLNTIADAQKRQDCFTLVELMRQATKAEPILWGSNIIGFGHQHYRYASGREGDWFVVGFSPRKQNLTLYLSGGLAPLDALLKTLGKHSAGKGCLYIKRLSDIDLATLTEMLKQTVESSATSSQA
jgi:hypothetical protein